MIQLVLILGDGRGAAMGEMSVGSSLGDGNTLVRERPSF